MLSLGIAGANPPWAKADRQSFGRHAQSVPEGRGNAVEPVRGKATFGLGLKVTHVAHKLLGHLVLRLKGRQIDVTCLVHARFPPCD